MDVIGAPPGGLVERQSELARGRALLDAAKAERGGILFVEGGAGIGKTTLLEAVIRDAQDDGVRVLRARGGELEGDFAYGVARQLFEPLLDTAAPREQNPFLQGAAQFAAPAIGPASAGGAAVDASTINHGLYWLTAQVADDGPVLLLVDDAHWADAPSLLFLVYLGRRIDELAVLLAVSVRSGEPGPAPDVLAALRALPTTGVVQPPPLTPTGTAALLAASLGTAPAPELRDACHNATGGNPFLVGQLAVALHEDPSPGAVAEFAPAAVAAQALARLRAVGDDAVALARAVAVLDADAELRHACALAGLGQRAAEDAADALSAAGILVPGRPLRFAHPIVRRVVYDDLPPHRRSGDHGRAARLLDDGATHPDRGAVHLLASEPQGDPWVVDKLAASASRALVRGAPTAAATMLARALLEPPPRPERGGILLAMGRAQRLCGSNEAEATLDEALAYLEHGSERVEALHLIAGARAGRGDPEGAIATLETALGDVYDDRETTLALRAEIIVYSQISPLRRVAEWAHTADTLAEGLSGETPAERALLGAAAHGRLELMRGPPEELIGLAERALALADPARGEGGLLSLATWAAVVCLLATDRIGPAEAALARFDDSARRSGSPYLHTLVSVLLARTASIRGDVAESATRARDVLDADIPDLHLLSTIAVYALVLALLERGDLDGADAALARHGLADGPIPPTTVGRLLLYARAGLRREQGRIEPALRDVEATLAADRERGGRFAAQRAARLSPALTLHAGGRLDDALDVARQDLEAARSFGVASPIGIAELVLGLVVADREEGLAHLQAAATALAASPRQLERARALLELGAALRRSGHRTAAREQLAAAMDIAHRMGATALTKRAHDELQAAGARPRRPVISGVESLTGAERRVAELAAAGLSNPEIAQAIFVTRKTIETHLGRIYRKLQIASREDLGAVLGQGDPDVHAARSPEIQRTEF